MKLMILLLVVGCLAAFASSKPRLNEWNEFKKQYGKEYADHEEDNMRMSIFMKNKKMVEEFNREESHKRGFKMGINHLSDWTEAELNLLNGYRIPQNFKPNISLEIQDYIQKLLNENTQIPDELDWRNVPNRVSSVKDQGKCGSCWAFSAVGTLEGQEITHNKSSLMDLSVQNLIDCARQSTEGCYGGFPCTGLWYAMNGIQDAKTYPYMGKDQFCLFKRDKVVFSDRGCLFLPRGEIALKNAVATIGPVSVGINVIGDEFFHYKAGIYKSNKCHNDDYSQNHGVLVVGYGTDPKDGDYWIVKNSWGDKWGEKGYIRMARNNNNMCGIADTSLIPKFN